MKNFILFFILSFSLTLSRPSLVSELQRRNLTPQSLGYKTDFLDRLSQGARAVNAESVDCALCGLAVNAVEGFLAEGQNEQEIEKWLSNNICADLSGELQTTCNYVTKSIPALINGIENHESVDGICRKIAMCSLPGPKPETVDIPSYKIDLDAAPKDRWKALCANPKYKSEIQYLLNTVQSILPGKGKDIAEMGNLIGEFFPLEYAQEIQGCAEAAQVPYGWLVWANLGYEVSDACTSIVAQTIDGKIYHARNLDFGAGMGFTSSLKNLTVQVDFIKSNKTLFHANTYVSYVGILSGMRPNGFSITVDTRFYPQGLWELFYTVVAALEESGYDLVSFLTRDTFTQVNNWKTAIKKLSDTPLIADVYYISAGVSSDEGAVISRNRTGARDVWILDNPSRWFEVETNYDHWEQPPWFDDRRRPANEGMKAMGQLGLSLDGMYRVLSTKPVLNQLTTYSILTSPKDDIYKSWVRNCNDPCPA